jgi:hypothetical protein
MLLLSLDITIGLTIQPRHLGVLLHDHFELGLITVLLSNSGCILVAGNRVSVHDSECLLLDVLALLRVVPGHGHTQDLCTRLLVIVTVSLRLHYVLVAGECVPVVHVAE